MFRAHATLRNFPWNQLSLVVASSAAFILGKKLEEERGLKRLQTNPGAYIEEAANHSGQRDRILESAAVQAINLSDKVKMAGATITNTLTPLNEATRRILHVNPYSRTAGGASLTVVQEHPDGLRILLLKNKRRPGKLLPSEGYGKFGPTPNTGGHCFDLSPSGIDHAEELILKGKSVREAYALAAQKMGLEQHGYGKYDLDFEATARRELREETGLEPKQLDYAGSDTSYNAKRGLATHVELYLAIVDQHAQPVPQDSEEIESVRFIPLSDIELQSDGSARVENFNEIIPNSHVLWLEKGLCKYRDLKIQKASEGLILNQEQLKLYAEFFQLPFEPFVPFGPNSQTSLAKQLSLAAQIKVQQEKFRTAYSQGTVPFNVFSESVRTPAVPELSPK